MRVMSYKLQAVGCSFLLLVPAVFLFSGCPASDQSPAMLLDSGEVRDVSLDAHSDVLQEVVEEKGCVGDDDCVGGKCNPWTHTCVDCLTSKDCNQGEICSKWKCVEVTKCAGPDGCPEGMLCDVESGLCVECLEDGDCGPHGVCKENSCVFGCATGCPAGLVCDAERDVCVECLSNDDCPEELWCYVPDNECVPDVCTPGSKGCVGNQTAICADDGSGWGDLEPCAEGFVCKQGECWKEEECTPGEAKCLDDFTVQVCSESGLAWKKVPCGPGEQCVLGECIGECVPLCAGKECGPSECPGISCGECKEDSYCGDDFKCHKGKCAPGQTKCVDGGVAECLGPEIGWSEPVECPPQTMCQDGKCVEVCIPKCEGKQCGPDGCGGQCGSCPEGMKCSAAGQCVGPCVPNCAGKECGPDGCGGNCGVCIPGTSCNSAGICEWVCKPNCEGKVCGSDGCGGTCGMCPKGEQCDKGVCIPAISCKELFLCIWDCGGNEECNSACWQAASPEAKAQGLEVVWCIEQVCAEDPDPGCAGKALQGECKAVWDECQNCTPACVGKMCGSDGCGGECGKCPPGFVCDDFGFCLCQPQCVGKECGPDGCGGSCGTCPAPHVCNSKGHCVCIPNCQNKECGPDGCGGSCGTCPQGMHCTSFGHCKPDKPDECGNGKCDPDESCENCPTDCSCEDCCTPHPQPGCVDAGITQCVCAIKKYCCLKSWDNLCVDLAVKCGAACGCIPQCVGPDGKVKECGPDGCGGSCGTCPPGLECNNMGHCVPVGDSCGNGVCDFWKGEDCETCPQDCGSCGCGDGFCAEDESCVTCPLDCGPCYEGDCCEPHNYPGCDSPEVVNCVCAVDTYCCQQMWDELCVKEATTKCGLVCECVPNCITSDGKIKECGPDGCGGVCGTCDEGEVCQEGVCVEAPPYYCGDMLDCASNCGFSLSCIYGCYGSGSEASKQKFKDLAYCVIAACGWNISKQCIQDSFAGACKEQYENCIADGS